MFVGRSRSLALEVAHNVEVGDYAFGEKNYNGALLRYNDAVEEKPGDLAIRVRLGRVLEKLNQSAGFDSQCDARLFSLTRDYLQRGAHLGLVWGLPGRL